MLKKDNYKDLDKWRKTKKKQKQKYYSKSRNAENRFQPWSEKDIELVMEHKFSDTQLSVMIGRSVQAIQTQRSKQKNKG